MLPIAASTTREKQKPQCNSPHIIDADLLMQTIAEVLKKIEDYSISNWAEFEALVKKNLAMQQTDKTKKQQKRIPQITTRLEQIDKVLNKLYEDNALGTIPQDRYEQMSQKYSEEYYALKKRSLPSCKSTLSAFEKRGRTGAEVFEADGTLRCPYRPDPRHSQRVYQPD